MTDGIKEYENLVAVSRLKFLKNRSTSTAVQSWLLVN